MRRFFRPIAAISAVLLLALSYSLAACSSKSGHKSSGPCCFNGPSQDLNGGGYTGQPSSPAAGPTDTGGFPKLSDDEIQELRGILMDGQCQLFLYPTQQNGFTVSDNLIYATIIIRCLYSVTQQTTVISMERRNPSTGKWDIQGGIPSSTAPVGGNVDNKYQGKAKCVKGAWRMSIYITGISYDKHTPFHGPLTGLQTPTFITDCTKTAIQVQ